VLPLAKGKCPNRKFAAKICHESNEVRTISHAPVLIRMRPKSLLVSDARKTTDNHNLHLQKAMKPY